MLTGKYRFRTEHRCFFRDDVVILQVQYTHFGVNQWRDALVEDLLELKWSQH